MVRSGEPSRASITLYRKLDFSEPLPTGPISLPFGSALHVGVSVENNDGFALLLENCYITKSSSAADPLRRFLIQNR